MENDMFRDGLTFHEFMNRESEYSDVSRALLAARHSQDSDLKCKILEQVGIRYDKNDPCCKVIDWSINLANSFAAGLSAVLDKPISELIMMDAQAYYEIEKVIFDHLSDN